MDEKKLMELLEAADGEIVFADGYALTDWSGGRYCVYSPEMGFGEGIVCGFETALDFYKAHC